jgi:hypothetical protein
MPAAGKRTCDPFNWPSQNRRDTMSLSSIDPSKDFVQTRTPAFRQQYRYASDNLNTTDIEGNNGLF